MKIKFGRKNEQHIDIDVSLFPVTMTGVFNGIGIETDQGCFGIAQRDGGIEVLLNGDLVWSSSEIIDEDDDV